MEHLLEVEPHHDDTGAAVDEAAAHQHRHAIDVEEGKQPQANNVRGQEPCREPLLDVAGDVVMGEHDPFGETRGAAGVGKNGQVLAGVDLDRPVLLGHAAQYLRQLVEGEDRAQQGEVLAGLLDGGGHGGEDEQGDRLRVGKLVLDIVRCIEGVEGSDRSAGEQDAVEDGRVLDVVGREDADLVPLLDAVVLKEPRYLAGVAPYAPIGACCPVGAYQGRLVAELLSGAPSQLRERDLFVGGQAGPIAGNDHDFYLLQAAESNEGGDRPGAVWGDWSRSRSTAGCVRRASPGTSPCPPS